MAEADLQEPLQWTDAYDGDPHTTPLLRQSDLVPFKPGTDVTFLGDAVNPDAATSAWTCSISLDDRLMLRLRVTGERHWIAEARRTWAGIIKRDSKPLLTGWRMSEPDIADRCDVSWSRAFGGPIPCGGDTARDVLAANPLGVGIVDLTNCDLRSRQPAPRIERIDDRVEQWSKRYEPAGFAPISPWWRPRQKYAGTYDAAWLEHRHPLLPEDFDERFWQCAAPSLVVEPWITGTETFRLENLHTDHRDLTATLPGILLGLTVHRPDSTREKHHLQLDGVHFDFRNGCARVSLTWRCRFSLDEAVGVDLVLRERARVSKHPSDAAAAPVMS